MLRRVWAWYGRTSWTTRGRLNQLHTKIDRLAAAQKQDEKWRGIFRRQLGAVIRHLYLSDADLAAPGSVAAQRFRLRSQNEEDGLTVALLTAGGLKTRRFVEIGCGGTGGNAALLAAEFGWNGIMIDAAPEAVERAARRFGPNPGVKVIQAFVTPQNVNELLAGHGFSGEVDLLSIDIDSIDYWVLEALDACSARVLVMEYNAGFGPTRAVTVPNAPVPKQAPKGYSGASLAALEKLASAKGYRLVICEDAGVNAFFLRSDVAPDIPGLSVKQAWRPRTGRFSAVDVAEQEAPAPSQFEEAGFPLVEV